MALFTTFAGEDSLGLFFCHRGHVPETKTEKKLVLQFVKG